MYRGRNVPSKSTPSTVQCQKCLKRGHYSYECKASAAERPYVPRPSRTQQLFNPKLLPKLTHAAPPQDKKGVADEILAQREAERAKKKALERDDESPSRDVSPRRSRSRSRSRSASVDSVSTISTRSPSPRPSRHARSPPPQRRAHAQDFFEPSARQRSVDSRDRYSSRRSESPVKHSSRRESPPPRHHRPPSPRRERVRERGRDSGRTRPSRRDYSVSESRSRSPIRSPVRRDSKGENHHRAAEGYYRDRDDGGRGQPSKYRSPSPQRSPQRREPSPPPAAPRERSLSPFSKRLALTQAMNRGR